MLRKSLYILGYSGHAYVVADAALSSGVELNGYFDHEENLENPYNLKFCGDENQVDINSIVGDSFVFPAVGNAPLRKKMIAFFTEKKLSQTAILHTKSIVSKHSEIGLSTLIGPGVIVNSRAKIGVGCIINSAAVIEHECLIANYTHIAPGAVLAGNVQVGTSSFIGANAVVKQGVKIGDNVTIGAGTVVLNDVPDGSIMVGNPAKNI